MSAADQTAALCLLKRRPLLYAGMINAILSGGAKLLWVGKNGVLLQTGDVTMMAAEDEDAAEKILRCLPRTDLLEIHQNFYRQAAEKKSGLPCGMICRQAAWLKKEPLPPVPSPAEIRPLGPEAFSFVLEHYKHADDPEYIRDRLRSGCFWGAFFGEDMAGFIGIHEEGSMGLLEVLPEYRRRGIAAELGTFLANRQLARGRIPFSQIETDNGASFALHRKLGFEITDRELYWLFQDE